MTTILPKHSPIFRASDDDDDDDEDNENDGGERWLTSSFFWSRGSVVSQQIHKEYKENY